MYSSHAAVHGFSFGPVPAHFLSLFQEAVVNSQIRRHCVPHCEMTREQICDIAGRYRSMRDDLDPIHGSAHHAIRCGAGNRGQGEARGVDGEHHVVAVGIVSLDEGAAEIGVGGVGQVDAGSGNSCPANLIGAGARGRAIVTIGVDIDVIAGGVRGQATDGDDGVLTDRVEIAIHHAEVSWRVRDVQTENGTGTPRHGSASGRTVVIDQGHSAAGSTAGGIPVGLGNNPSNFRGCHGSDGGADKVNADGAWRNDHQVSGCGMGEAAAGTRDGDRGSCGGRSAVGGDGERGRSATADGSWRETGRGASWQATRTESHSSGKSVQGPDSHRVGGGTPDGHGLRRRRRGNREIRGGRNHQASGG